MSTALMFLMDADWTSAYEANRLVFVVLPAFIVYAGLDFIQFKKARTQSVIEPG